MASSHSDAARMEQIITEFFAKSLHIILETRSPFMSSRNFSGEQILSSPSSSSSSSSSVRPRDKWFNLALRECPEAMENLDLWRQSNLEPMIVDVILVKRTLNWDPISYSPKPELGKNDASTKEVSFFSEQEELGSERRSEKIIERWVVQYELKKTKDSGKGGKRSSSNVLSVLYKKSMLLLRSLYLTVRLLPAYKIFRDLNLTGQIHSFSLIHRVSSFAEPFTRREEAEMQRFLFTPVDTHCGRLCLSVLYRSSVSDMSSGPSTPMSPQFIPDYVGSPLADPLKRFPSVPTSHGSPSQPFSRRHSWSFDRGRASPTCVSYSPSPTNSEPYGPASNPASRRVPPASLPVHPPESHPHKESPCYDELYPSPVFSPSSSPSPPMYTPGNQLPKLLQRSESAPVNIPTRKLPNSPSLLRNQYLPPSPSPKGSRCSTYKTDKAVVPTHIGATVDKMVAAGKEDSRRYAGMRIPLGSSLQISLSRSSSRSYDYDETEFTCPFDVEYDEEPGTRPESFDQRGHLREPLEPGALLPIRKSHGAAVGTLVYMLNKARPLSQDYSQSTVTASSQPSITETGSSLPEVPPSPLQDSNSITTSSSSSRVLVLRTTTDALEELKGYRDIKNMLLKKSPA